MPEVRIDRFNSSLHLNLVKLDQVPFFEVLLIPLTSKSLLCIEF
jgi:hypothetical protein